MQIFMNITPHSCALCKTGAASRPCSALLQQFQTTAFDGRCHLLFEPKAALLRPPCNDNNAPLWGTDLDRTFVSRHEPCES